MERLRSSPLSRQAFHSARLHTYILTYMHTYYG